MIAFNQPQRIKQCPLEKKLSENAPFIEKFLEKYNVGLVAVTTTNENGFFQLAYEFTDEQGCYTIDGIKRSLEEE